MLKKGLKKIPHFACVNKTIVCTSPGEKVSLAHKLMEEFIQSFLNIPDSDMEYSKITGVRPDALYLDKYAIEMQYSNITLQEIERRNNIYLTNGKIPIWIFHANEIVETPVELGIFAQPHHSDKYRLKDAEIYFEERFGSVFYLTFPKGNPFPAKLQVQHYDDVYHDRIVGNDVGKLRSI